MAIRPHFAYRPEIDGLRAVAVLPVILFHAGFEAFSGGFVGVDIFFVISGYLITSILVQEAQDHSFSFTGFYERRARRLLPALFFVMLVCLPFAWLWLLPADMKEFSSSLIAVSSFLSNFLFWKSSGYFETAAELKPLLHTWSLAVEEQYYLFFPIILMLTWRLARRWLVVVFIALALASLALAQWGTMSKPAAAFYLLPARLWELLVGALTALYLTKRQGGISNDQISQIGSFGGMLLVFGAIFAFDRQTPFPGLYALVPTIGTALIILHATPQTVIGQLLSQRIPVAIGLISYSAYLWHQPLLAFARHASLHEPSRLLLGSLAAASLVLAYFSWRYVETPFRNRQRFSRRQVFAMSGVGIMAFSAIGLAGTASAGFPYSIRLPDTVLKITRSAEDVSDITGSLEKPVLLGTGKGVSGVLIGDSHAESLAQALAEELGSAERSLLVYTKAGCPPVRGLYRFDLPSYGAKCDVHYKAVYDRLAKDDSLQTVVISARFTLYLESERFDNGEGGVETGASKQVLYDGLEYKDRLRNLDERRTHVAHRLVSDIRHLLDMGKKVILVYPIPEVGWNVPVYAAKLALVDKSDTTLSTSHERYRTRNARAIATLDSIGTHTRLVRIYPELSFCDTQVKERCIAITDSQALYRDTNHLTNGGARYLTRQIANSL